MCSYGFNRTGFVLCVYLIEELGMTADQALQAFARSRPPGEAGREAGTCVLSLMPGACVAVAGQA